MQNSLAPSTPEPNATAASTILPAEAVAVAEDLCLRYQEKGQRDLALDRLTFSVPSRQSVALVGANGSGKTTLLKLMAGLYRPSSGSIRIHGADPAVEPMTRSRISYVPASDSLLPGISVRDNLVYRAGLRGLVAPSRDSVVAELLHRYGLEDLAAASADSLSSGQLRRISFISASLGSPDVVLLDEPTTGVDINALVRIHDHIRHWSAQGSSVFLATHHAEEIFDLCDFVLVLSAGQPAFFGRTVELGSTFESFRSALRMLVVDR